MIRENALTNSIVQILNRGLHRSLYLLIQNSLLFHKEGRLNEYQVEMPRFSLNKIQYSG